MENFDVMLDKYAELVVKVGVNIQKGQTLVINAPISSKDFVRKVALKAYEIGAKNVHVLWNDEVLTRMKFDMAPMEAFKEYPLWMAKGFEELAENGAAFITIHSTDPELLKGVDPIKIADANKSQGQAMKVFRQYTQADKVSWLVISAPSETWAKRVFPNASEEDQVEKLWDAIFRAVRINEADPIAEWKKHDENLRNKAKLMTNKQYKALKLTAEGTDLTIELPKDHIWFGGGGPNEKGTHFIANMPTEEVFTAPKRDGVNGFVTNTKPLNYGGNTIDGFTLTFKDGKVVDFTAKEGEETLKHLLATDEGSSFLGEVALVPHSSPISQSGILFYNTLFDENASCHIALGSAYPTCIKDGSKMSQDDLKKHGVNTSITHVDFMIGSAQMDIDGVLEDGSTEAVFRQGEWVI